jgi:hypothetical protein
MHVFSPPPSWYEPPDLIEVEDEPAPEPAEVLHVAAGAVSWTRPDDDTDD